MRRQSQAHCCSVNLLQQDDDLPNMATVTKKDPSDLEFKLNHRDICRKCLTSVDYIK